MNKTGHLLTKVCESTCPNCGAGQNDIEWELFDIDDPPSQVGTCNKCGCEFREYYEYSNTEWYTKKKTVLKEQKQDIEIKVGDKVINIHLEGQDGKGRWLQGEITTNLHEDPPLGTVENESDEETFAREKFNSMMDGIESFLLALACEGGALAQGPVSAG